MAVLEILHYPEPVLKEKSLPVASFDDGLRQLATDMAETMYDAPGVGLAAPQVGVLKRMVVIDCSGSEDPPDLIVAVNPEIISREGDCMEEEGCLSVPGYFARIARSARVKVRYQDLNGNTQEREADELLAVAIQHEIDHLDGVLFVDRLSSLKRSIFRKKYQKMQEQEEQE